MEMKKKKKKAGVAKPIPEKMDLKIKTVTRDKEEYYTVLMTSIQEENITAVNIYMHPT